MNPPTACDAEVACFGSCKAKSGGKNLPFAEVISGIKEGRWSQSISALRRIPYKSSSYDQLKERLPCFMMSASTRTGSHKASDIRQHSGLLQLDIDGLGASEAEALRDRLVLDPHLFAVWLSPGGEGVKAAMRIPADVNLHRQAFEAASRYIRQHYAVEIDRQCSDPCRLCFVSYDPDLRLNPESVELVIPAEPPMPKIAPQTLAKPTVRKVAKADLEKGGVRLQGDSSESLSPEPDSESYLLHNKHALFLDFSSLVPLYEQHVVKRLGTPQRGTRNAALVELVAGNFCVVKPDFVLAFAEVFHRDHPALFADYPEAKWMNEARCLLAGCLESHQKKMGPPQASVYALMPSDDHATAFRICQSLAACDTDPAAPPPTFYLSAEQLGTRLGMLPMQAWRIRDELEKRSAIRTLKKGFKRAAGMKATATTYEWLFPLPAEPRL